MQQPVTLEFGWTGLHCASTSTIFIPISPWRSAPPVLALRCPFELRALVGVLKAQAAYQTANDSRNPDSAVAFGAEATTAGHEDPSGFMDVSSAYVAKEYYRFGFLCSNSSGTGLSLARVAGALTELYR